MKRINKILTLIATLAIVSASAQVQLDNAVLYNNGATIYISGVGAATANTVSDSSSIHNLGNIIFDGDYTQTNNKDTLSNHNLANEIEITGDFDIQNGIYDGSNQNGNTYLGTLKFSGITHQQFNATPTNNNHVFDLVINNSHDAGVDINGMLLVNNSIDFSTGRFNTTSSDSLALLDGGVVVGTPSLASHVNGPFYREGSDAAAVDLMYPIGDSANYRPVTLKDVPLDLQKPIVGFDMVSGATGGSAGLGVGNIVDTRYWHSVVVGGAYHGATLELSYEAAETITDQALLVVAEASTSNGVYQSLDQSSVTGAIGSGTVVSAYNANESYFVIGEAGNMRVNVNALLEGPHTGGSTMHDSLHTRIAGSHNYLENRYVENADSTNPYGIAMLKGYLPPAGAVDVVKLTLRATSNLALDLDTTYAWLMTDGTIKDFSGGELDYATFDNTTLTSGATYCVAVWHRNHAPLMYTMAGQAVSRTTPPILTFDLTDPNNIYGIGSKDLGGGKAGLYLGNAEQNVTLKTINAFDAYIVGNKAANGMPMYYHNTDVDMDGFTNNSDWTKTNWANNQLYYATLP